MSLRHLMRRTKALLERETSCRRISKSRSWILKASTNRALHRQFAATCTLLEGTPMRGWHDPRCVRPIESGWGMTKSQTDLRLISTHSNGVDQPLIRKFAKAYQLLHDRLWRKAAIRTQTGSVTLKAKVKSRSVEPGSGRGA